jgi:hypothetical protein
MSAKDVEVTICVILFLHRQSKSRGTGWLTFCGQYTEKVGRTSDRLQRHRSYHGLVKLVNTLRKRETSNNATKDVPLCLAKGADPKGFGPQY